MRFDKTRAVILANDFNSLLSLDNSDSYCLLKKRRRQISEGVQRIIDELKNGKM